MKFRIGLIALIISGSLLAGCQTTDHKQIAAAASKSSVTGKLPDYYGTGEPFASNAIYFVMTDRFVDGDKSNDYPHQGGDHPTYKLPLYGPNGQHANIGYMGGDFKGIVDNGAYIEGMGFTSVWISPIVDNPDQSFSGGDKVHFGESFKDGGKTGYHGYWADNFWKVDEHWPSKNLSFKQFTQTMRQKYGLKTVLDIVCNHGTPSFSMPEEQPKFGKIYDKNWHVLADHQNLPPSKLDSKNPLHQFFRHNVELAQLSNLDDRNPKVQNYLINAYLHWIDQGADAFRIDTIKFMPHKFWKLFADRIRAKHPGFFMFGEAFDYNAKDIASYTLKKNGSVSVLDFPGQKAINAVFAKPNSDFAQLKSYLHLTHGPYANPYELVTFYDNHDMPRMNATDNGFIDANNWLFTSRGIPAIYQGSEMGFMRGKAEHQGNRNYFGEKGIEQAKQSPIYAHLKLIANVRKHTPALQRGLQLNVKLSGDQAVFYRVLQDKNIQQTVLVLLNKGDKASSVSVKAYMQPGVWTEALTGQQLRVSDQLRSQVKAHGVQVWVRQGPVTGKALNQQLAELMADKSVAI